MRGQVDVLKGKGLPGYPRPRGTYDPKAAYQALDFVAKDSSSFVAVRDNPGSCPGDDWQMMACGGKRGPAGERGPPGPAGTSQRLNGAALSFRENGVHLATRMHDASPGPVISIFKTIRVDPEDFTLKFVGCDDSVLRISLLPLFEAYHRQTTG